MQMLEFVVERGVFYLIHATVANRSAFSAVRTAVDMVKSKLITEQEAIMRLDPFHLQQLVEPIVDPALGNGFGSKLRLCNCVLIIESLGENVLFRKVGRGVPASYGMVCGELVFSSQEAIECRRRGTPCILCLPQSSANDIGGLEVM